MNVEVIALQRQCYNGAWKLTNEKFFVSEEELPDMEAVRPPLVRRATEAEQTPKAQDVSYESRTMQAKQSQDSGQQTKVSNSPPMKGKYDRRDMRAR